MDLTGYQNIVQDFFQESRINGALFPQQNSAYKQYDEQEIFKFQTHRNQPQPQLRLQPQPQTPSLHEYKQQNQQNSASNLSSSNEIDNLFLNHKSQQLVNQILNEHENPQGLHEQSEARIQTNDLEQIITFIVQLQSNSLVTIDSAVKQYFPQFYRRTLIQVLIEKFSKLKKTKEQIIKYCMRKAFKFILELPQNQNTQGDKKQKYSFSKCKNKYVKRFSQQKSMNNKFLHQVFTATGFKRDYLLFLEHFEDIMIEDNSKKISYLASLLTKQKQNKNISVEMVKRLPWTTQILNKVRVISKDLLKFAQSSS